MDKIEILIKQAHKLFGKASVFEVIDLTRLESIRLLVGIYGPVDVGKANRYFMILDRAEMGEAKNAN